MIQVPVILYSVLFRKIVGVSVVQSAGRPLQGDVHTVHVHLTIGVGVLCSLSGVGVPCSIMLAYNDFPVPSSLSLLAYA